MAIAKARNLTQEEINEILKIKKEDVTLDTFRDLFGCKLGQAHPRFNTYDKFTLQKNPALHVDKPIETTVGRYILNLVVFPEKLLAKTGYINYPLNKKAIGKLEDTFGDMILNDQMTTKEYADYMDKAEWVGMGTEYFLEPTMNYDINVPIDDVIKKRDELFDKYSSGIRKGDPNVANVIEKELIELARKEIKSKGNEAYDFFESGVFSFENNYKKTSIMCGAMQNPYTKKIDILRSNYIDGINKDEYSKFSNLTIIGGYSRGVETQKGGYQTKKINNATQGIVLDEHGTDCGTKFYAKITIPKAMKDMYVNRYVIDPASSEADEKGLVLLTKNNIDKYIEKPIKLRSPMYCKGDRICNKCAGEMFYKMGVTNAGLYTFAFSGKLMNMSLKKFHDATLKFNKIDIKNYIIKS